MPLQLSEFTDLPLLFIILESCHYNFTNLRTIPLHTISLCFLNFMDKNTPDLLLPPLISLSFLSISAVGRRARAAPPAARRLGHCGLPAGGKHPRPLEAAAAPPAARRPGGPCRRGSGHGGRGTTLAGRRARGEATGPWDGTLHRRRPPSRLPTFLPGAPARWPWGADGGLARARARRAVVEHSCGGPARGGRPTEAARFAEAGTAPPPCVPSPSLLPGGLPWRLGEIHPGQAAGLAAAQEPLLLLLAPPSTSAPPLPLRWLLGWQPASSGWPRPGGRRTRGGGRWRARRMRPGGAPPRSSSRWGFALEREGKEGGVRGRRRSGVFLSIKFKKHSESVCSGMVRRFVKL